MTSFDEPETIILEKDSHFPQSFTTLVAQLIQVRKELYYTLEKVSEESLDYTPNERKIETIGTLLLHIAAVEWSWIFEDIDKKKMDFEKWKYAFALRPTANVPQLKNKGMKFYIDQLESVRKEVLERLLQFSNSDIEKLVESDSIKYSIESNLYHLVEHEAIHIGQINLLNRMYKLENNDPEKIIV